MLIYSGGSFPCTPTIPFSNSNSKYNLSSSALSTTAPIKSIPMDSASAKPFPRLLLLATVQKKYLQD